MIFFFSFLHQVFTRMLILNIHGVVKAQLSNRGSVSWYKLQNQLEYSAKPQHSHTNADYLENHNIDRMGLFSIYVNCIEQGY